MYTNEASQSEAGRLFFAGDYLNGDASLLISDLLLTDSGEYTCKVKTGGKYHWDQVNLVVLGECRTGSGRSASPHRRFRANECKHTHTRRNTYLMI